MNGAKRKTETLRVVIAAVASVLVMVTLAAAGCRKNAKTAEITKKTPDATDAPEKNGEEKDRKRRFSAWEERTVEEIIKVGALTSLPSDMLVYDARDFGIDPDDRKDHARDIEAACREVSERGGGILFFPSGRYNIGSTVVIEGGDSWLCLCGEADGSSKFALASRFGDDAGVRVARDNTHFSFISIEDPSKDTTVFSLEADGCSLYGCSFNKTYAKATKTCLEVSSSFDTVRQCSFWAENRDTCFVEFTKYPGRDAYGNVMCDVHFGGEFAKTVLVSSRDGAGAQENLIFFRNLFLIQSNPNIEVRTVNGLTIANNMLDAAKKAVTAAPEGFGVFNVEIRDNYIGTASGGVTCEEGDANGGGISIRDNYFWSPEAVTVSGKKYTDVTAEHNYFVLTGGSAVYMTYAANALIRDNLTANISVDGESELKIIGADERSVIETTGFGRVQLPDRRTEKDAITVPAVPRKEMTFKEPPAVTGDKVLPINEKYINVKENGAAGDGIADDTDAIRRSIEKATKINGTVYFPEGCYLVKDTITVPKNDAAVLRFKGDGAEKSVIKGDAELNADMFVVKMKYNFFMYDVGLDHAGSGSALDALFVKAFDCEFKGSVSNSAPLLSFHGSNCWAVRCRFSSGNSESYGISYTRLPGEISINDYIVDNVFLGEGKGVLVGDGVSKADGRCEGLKIIGNTFGNRGRTGVEIYEILHVNIAYNRFDGPSGGIFLSNLGHGPDGIYIDHNTVKTKESCIFSGNTAGGSDYISMVVIHDNELASERGKAVDEVVKFNKKMIHDQVEFSTKID